MDILENMPILGLFSTHTSTVTMCDPLGSTNYQFYFSVYVDFKKKKSVKEVMLCFLGFCDM